MVDATDKYYFTSSRVSYTLFDAIKILRPKQSMKATIDKHGSGIFYKLNVTISIHDLKKGKN